MRKASLGHSNADQDETYPNAGTEISILNFPGRAVNQHPSLPVSITACEREETMWPKNRKEMNTYFYSVERALPESQATLWANNPDITAILQFLFERSSFQLRIVATTNEVLEAATCARPDDFLIIDCITATDALERCASIVTQTAIPVYICHSDKEFVDNLQIAARGEVIWLPPMQTGLSLLNKLRLLKARSFSSTNDQASNPLTTREEEVLRLIAIGLTNPQIAERLSLSQSTVKTHVAEIKRKLGLATRADVISAYYRATGGDHQDT